MQTNEVVTVKVEREERKAILNNLKKVSGYGADNFLTYLDKVSEGLKTLA